jgi:dTDP-4-amino-4,6-dideoxygalactose transaminase
VFVDVDPERYTIDAAALRDAIQAADNPAAIAVTHMHGQPAAMAPIVDLADDHGLSLVEDAAQAHGATYEGQRAGSFGDVGCFSFYPSKNMTVGGDGGMIVTDDTDLARTARRLRNHGRDEDGVHRTLGLNYRLDEMNAVVGRQQLTHLDDWNGARVDAAAAYTERLADVDPVVTPTVADDCTHVFHHYPVQVPDRAAFRDTLSDANVETGIHYETPAHRHPAVTDRVDVDAHPRAERLCDRLVSLPMHPRLDETEVAYVCATIREHYE